MPSKPLYLGIALKLFAVWTIIGMAFSGVEYIASALQNRPNNIWLTIISSVTRSYLWGMFSPVIYLIAKGFPIDPKHVRWKNLGANLLIGLLISVTYGLIFIVFGWVTEESYANRLSSVPIFFQSLLLSTLYTIFSLYSPTFFTVQAILFFRNYKDEEAKNAALRAELSTARLGALKMQLHPHFLFNSLHAISSLILVNPNRATKMVALLGDFLRQTLDHSKDQMATLEEELGFLRCYLEIEETRFVDRLSVDYKIEPETLRALVPHMILQPIVENAVKHGIAPFEAPGRIAVAAKREGDDLIINVNDSGYQPNGSLANENGVGINNVRSRLDVTYGSRAWLDIRMTGKGCTAEIGIPFQLESREK